MTMLSPTLTSKSSFILPVASDRLDLAIVSSEGNIESYHCVASLNQIQVLSRDVSLGSCSIEEQFDLL